MARRSLGGPAGAAQIRRACRQPDDVPPGGPGSTTLRLADRAVVVVVQSRALVGARGCHRVDGCCSLDDIAPGSPVHRGRHGLRPANVHRPRARPRPRRRRSGLRRLTALRWVSMIVAIVLACGVFTLLRTDGVTGDAGSQLAWRWTPTAEERLLAQTRTSPSRRCRPGPLPEYPVSRLRPRPARARKPSPSLRPKPSGTSRASGGDASGVARFSRSRSQQRHSRCAIRLRLVKVATNRTVAPGDRTGLVVVRRSWRFSLHAGAARRRRDRRLLQEVNRPTGLETSRFGPVLGVECRRRSTATPALSGDRVYTLARLES